MPFSFYSPPQAREPNPAAKAFRDALEAYQSFAYKYPSMEEAIQKARQENAYYGPNMESQMALRKAQTGEAGARAGLINAQQGRIPLEMELLKAQAQSQSALGAKRNAVQQLLAGLMQGGPVSGNANEGQFQSASFEQPQSLSHAISNEFNPYGVANEEEIRPPLMQPNLRPSPKTNLTYPQAAFLSQELGLGQPKIIEVDGQHLAVTPFGNIPLAQGQTAEEKAFKTGMAKENVKFLSEAAKTYEGYSNQGIALGELADAVQNNPEFRNVTGPINRPITNWLGTPEQKELLGRLQTASGEIALQIAPSLKGAWTGRDQAMVNDIKASPRDFPDVFIGKLKAQMLVNKVLQERIDRQSHYVREGMDRIDAAKLAAKQTPLQKIKPQIDKLVGQHPANRQKLNGKEYMFNNGKWEEVKNG